MATQEKEVPVKASTRLSSPQSNQNRRHPPTKLESLEDFNREYVYLIECIKNGSMTSKQIEQYNTALRGARYTKYDLELSMIRLVLKYKERFSPKSDVLKELMPHKVLDDGRLKKLA